MKRGVFITGTDTNIGKTVVSAALLTALRESRQVRYWKPIQTGIEDDNDTHMVRELAQCFDNEIYDQGYRLEKPLSPHLSARLANTTISIDLIQSWSDCEDDDNTFWIVEGAGGVFVPLNEDELMVDLIARLELPVIVVARSGLGTINHTLLTLAALRAKQTVVAGVIMNGEPNVENKRAVERYGQVHVLAELPRFERLNHHALQQWAREQKSIVQSLL